MATQRNQEEVSVELDRVNRPSKTNESIDNRIAKLIECANDSTPTQQQRSKELEALAKRLYDAIPDECWMTEKTLSKKIDVPTRQIKNAKSWLQQTGQIVIKRRSNGARTNPKHVMIKVPSAKPLEMNPNCFGNIDWSIFDNLALKTMNSLSLFEVLELYQRMNLPFIPLHFPKFNKNGRVFCSCSLGKSCESIGKHPVVTFKELDFTKTSTFQEMKSWWSTKELRGKRGNRFNVGLLTRGFSVIDIDRRYWGHYNLALLQERYGELPQSLVSSTGDGRHIYTTDTLKSGTNILDYSGIDIRSTGSYIIAPPSLHYSGRPYRWECLSTPDPLPIELREAISKKPLEVETKSLPTSPLTYLSEEVIPKGRRKTTLFSEASKLRGMGKECEEISNFINRLNQTRCSEPLSASSLADITKSVMKFPTNAQKTLALSP